MCNKFNAVSSRIISSYNWELSKKKIIPKDPVLYRKMLQEELHLSPMELVFEFVGFLTEAERRKKEASRPTKSSNLTQAKSRHANAHLKEEKKSKQESKELQIMKKQKKGQAEARGGAQNSQRSSESSQESEDAAKKASRN